VDTTKADLTSKVVEALTEVTREVVVVREVLEEEKEEEEEEAVQDMRQLDPSMKPILKLDLMRRLSFSMPTKCFSSRT